MKRAEFKCQDRQAEVWIYDMIGSDFFGDGVSAKSFAEDLAALGDIDTLTVRINSPGGDVFDGNTIFNALHRFPAEIVVAVDGVAASAAALIAMAGDRITMAENAMMMIHEASGGVYGRASEHRHIADVLDKVNESQITAYVNQSEKDRETVAAWLEEETWFTAVEAVEAGMADEVTKSLQVAAWCLEDGKFVQEQPWKTSLSASVKDWEQVELRPRQLAALCKYAAELPDDVMVELKEAFEVHYAGPVPYRRAAAENLLTQIGP